MSTAGRPSRRDVDSRHDATMRASPFDRRRVDHGSVCPESPAVCSSRSSDSDIAGVEHAPPDDEPRNRSSRLERDSSRGARRRGARRAQGADRGQRTSGEWPPRRRSALGPGRRAMRNCPRTKERAGRPRIDRTHGSSGSRRRNPGLRPRPRSARRGPERITATVGALEVNAGAGGSSSWLDRSEPDCSRGTRAVAIIWCREGRGGSEARSRRRPKCERESERATTEYGRRTRGSSRI